MTRIKKRVSAFLVFVLILEMVAGAVFPFRLTLKSPYVRAQKAFASTPWYNASWLYRKQITIDHTKVSGDQTNFPVLISLDALSNINANGTDIRFTSSDGTTELPREIESYSSGSLRAWVKIPALSSSTDTAIYMYYGNSGATEPSATSTYGSQNVWKTDGVDTSNVMTQHMTDNPDTSHTADSTANANNGTKASATHPAQATGQIGNGQSFNGTTDYVDAGNGGSLNIVNTLTISTWIKIPAEKVGYALHPITKYLNTLDANYVLYAFGTTGGSLENKLKFYANASGTWQAISDEYNLTGNYGKWLHIVLSYDKTLGGQLYVNGVAIGIRTGSGVLATSSHNLFLNGQEGEAVSLDEIRIYSRALSAGEITTQYNNQNSPSTFYTLGIEEKQSPAALTSWSYRKAITIDHTKVSGDQTNFPILVNLSSDVNLASHALSTGNDILFASSSALWSTGTENDKLAHEIEKYNSTTGELEAWVRIPSLSSTVDTVIYMYYGNASSTSQQNKTVVWDGSAKMVAHLSETGNGTAGEYKDSTSNANNGQGGGGTAAAVPTASSSGQIDGAQTFDGTDDYVDASSSSFNNLTGDLTVEAWFNLKQITATYGSCIVCQSYPQYGTPDSGMKGFQLYLSNAYPEFKMYGVGVSVAENPNPINLNTWYHAVGIISGTTLSFYLNGVFIGSKTIASRTNTSSLWIGGEKYFNLSWLNGSVDEPRVYNRALTAGEITTQYNNQNSPSTFYALGSEEYFDHFVITGAGTMNAGASQTVTITAKTNLGNTYAGYTGDKSLTFSGANVSAGGNSPTCSDKNSLDVSFATPETITFSSGVATCTLKLYKAETATINTTDGAKTATGNTLSVTVSSTLSGGSIQINSGASYTGSKNTTLTLSAVNASQMKFSNDNTAYSTYESYGTSKAWDITNSSYGGTSSDGTKTVWVKYNDSYGNEATPVSSTIGYDTTAPSGGAITYTDGYYTTASVALTASDGTDSGSGINTSSRTMQRRSATLSGGSCGSYGSFSTVFPSGSYPNYTDTSVTSGNCYQYRYLVSDTVGNQTAYTGTNTAKVDTSAPSAPGSPSTSSPTNSSSQTWSWSAATDALSGIASYAWRTTTTLGAAVANGTTSALSAVTNLAEGAYNFFVKAIDNAGNQGAESQGSVVVDQTPPVTTDSGTDANWHNSNVTVTLLCADSSSGCNHTYYTTDGTTPTTSSTQGTSITLSSDGVYTIKYFSTDMAGNTEPVKTAANTVKIDKTAPSVPGTPQTLTPTNNTEPAWNWTASTDSGSGLASSAYTIQWSKDATFSTGVYSATSSTNSYTHTNPLTNGTWYLRVMASDTAGNSSSYSSNGSVVINTSAPAGSVAINSGDTYTNTTGVTLTLTASDNVDPQSSLQMEISNISDFSGATYEPFMASKAWTLTSTDGGKTVYVRIKDTSGNIGTYSASITLDTTPPNSFDLDSPDNDSYTNSGRPTFRWKAAATPDATSGLAKYKLSIDNGDSGSFVIDGIPASRTTDYETTKYLVHYDGFSDTDSSNNYISVYTKHSSDWGSSENDGKLNPGKRTWTITAYDNAGNTTSEGRTLYADYTNPSLGDIAFNDSDILGNKDGYTVISNLKPAISGDISDNYSPDKIEVSFSKQNFLLGIETGRTLFLKETYDLKNDTNQTTLSFSFSPSLDLDYGKYRVDVTGIDKAGNKSAADSLSLWVLPGAQAKLVLTRGKTKEEQKKITEEVNNNSQVSLPELEKKAILRREKEAEEFGKLTQELEDSFSIFFERSGKSITSLVLAGARTINLVFSNTSHAIGNGMNNFYSVTASGSEAISQNISNNLIALYHTAANSYKGTAKAVPGIAGDAMLVVGKNVNNFMSLNYRLGNQFTKEQENIKKQIVKTQGETGDQIKTAVSVIALAGNAISDGIIGVNRELTKSQEQTKKQIAKAHQGTTDAISRMGVKAKEGGNVALRSILDPAEKSKNFADKLIKSTLIAVVTFQSYMFDDAPTKIEDVALSEVGRDYAIVTWKTNHYTRNNKVNYGQTLTYDKSAWGSDGEKNHRVKITKLKPGVKYFFEVMSQNKNYAYDAYYSFETKK